jgi:hypothetical protein
MYYISVLELLAKHLNGWIHTCALEHSKRWLANQHQQKKNLPFSVPQGSCAGPVLYNIYVSTLQQDIEQHGMELLGYADDQLTYKTFKAGNKEAENLTISSLEECLKNINI